MSKLLFRYRNTGRWGLTGGGLQGLWELSYCYWHSAQALAEFGDKPRKPNYANYPVAYLYRHSLELVLKAIALTRCPELGIKSSDILNTHNLQRTFNVAKRAIENAAIPEEDEMGYSLADVKAVVEEWTEVDNGSMAFRYGIDKDGETCLPKGPLPISPSEFDFDLESFCSTMDRAALATSLHVLFHLWCGEFDPPVQGVPTRFGDEAIRGMAPWIRSK